MLPSEIPEAQRQLWDFQNFFIYFLLRNRAVVDLNFDDHKFGERFGTAFVAGLNDSGRDIEAIELEGARFSEVVERYGERLTAIKPEALEKMGVAYHLSLGLSTYLLDAPDFDPMDDRAALRHAALFEVSGVVMQTVSTQLNDLVGNLPIHVD